MTIRWGPSGGRERDEDSRLCKCGRAMPHPAIGGSVKPCKGQDLAAHHTCEACGHDMPGYALGSFADDDDRIYFLCTDTESCMTRLGGMVGTSEASYLTLAIGQLTKRVIELERWRQREKDGGR